MLNAWRFLYNIKIMSRTIKFETMMELANIDYDLSQYDPKAQWRYFNQDLELENKPLISYENWYETEKAKDYCKRFNGLENMRNQILQENPEISEADINSFMDLYWWDDRKLNEVPENWFDEVKMKTAKNAKCKFREGVPAMDDDLSSLFSEMKL